LIGLDQKKEIVRNYLREKSALTGNNMIPISKPYLGKKEVEAATNVILSGWVTQGPKVNQFEEAFSNYVGSKYSCAVSSCTTALHIALLSVGVKPGDVVITVSHSFIATANSIRHCSAEPIFLDVDQSTYNITPDCLKNFIDKKCIVNNNELYCKDITMFHHKESPLRLIKEDKIGRVSAIIPVHQIGMPCEIQNIVEIASKYNIPVIEDAACAIGSEIKFDDHWDRIGKPHGDIACFSFHPRKVVTTGDGGMLTTNNPEYDKKFRLLRQHGMNIPDTVRHKAKKVIIENYLVAGYNYRMTDIQAAIGIEQLKKLPNIISERIGINKIYREYLGDIDWLDLPYEPDYARTNWQSYAVRILDNCPKSRNELIQFLLDNGISSKPGVMNAHLEKPYLDHCYSLPNSELSRDQTILLPLFNGMSKKNLEYISDVLHNV